MNDDINSLSHSKWRCKYHIVFAPKYRRKVIYGDIRKDIGVILRKLSQSWKKAGTLARWSTRIPACFIERLNSLLYQLTHFFTFALSPRCAPTWHLPQALHAPQAAQFPPQELLPVFLSRIILRISRNVTAAMTAMRTILIRLADSQASMGSHPFGNSAAPRGNIESVASRRCHRRDY